MPCSAVQFFDLYRHPAGPPVHHFDLYRLDGSAGGEVFYRLDLPSSFNRAVSLVEWAERLPDALLPPDRLEVSLEVLDVGHGASGSSSNSSSSSTLADEPPAVLQLRVPPCCGTGGDLSPESGSGGGSSSGVQGTEVMDTGDDSDPYTDTRPRLVTLRAWGDDWAVRLQALTLEM